MSEKFFEVSRFLFEIITLQPSMYKQRRRSSTGGMISELPEDCISYILSLTSPQIASQLSLVSSTFKSAADSNVVWERFLPPDYKTLLTESVSKSSLIYFSSKKELYFHLCSHPVLLQGGNKSLKLEKHSGKKCLMIGAKELTFVCSPRYCKWTSGYHSRFDEVAELVGACFFEICGKIETQSISSKTTYVAYLVVKFSDKAPGNGVDNLSVEVSVKFVSGGGLACSGKRRVYLATPGRWGIDLEYVRFPKKRSDGWMEFEMGEFYNREGEDGQVVEMSLTEVKGLHWKYGVIVQGIELRPKTEILS